MSQEIKIAIIAASSALLGAIISQSMTWLLSHLEKKRQKHILLRQKYEEMWLNFSSSLEWIVRLNGSTSQEAVFQLAQNPEARKAASLCFLYFREELGDAANNYLLAQQSYYQSLIKVYDKNDKDCTAGGQFMIKDPGYKVSVDNLFAKKNLLENLIISNANKYTIV